MNRRKQHLSQFKLNYHERRKRWVDRRHRSRLWGIIMVPFLLVRRGVLALLGREDDRH